MSQNSNFLKNTLDLLESDSEVKSYIYQQLHDFSLFVTPDTLVMVIARDPTASYAAEATEPNAESSDESVSLTTEEPTPAQAAHKYRIAVILKEGDSSIESEAFHDDVFEAIRLAKEKLLERLIEIRDEVESPQDRIKAIKEASDNTQIH
ncbi:MAG: hypothetical protein AABY53_03925 [Bdellovibrionota bacterium]